MRPNFWSIGFKRVRDGKVVVMEKSHRKALDRGRLEAIMHSHRVVTYNGMTYDIPLIFYLLAGREQRRRLKQASDQHHSTGNVKYWDVEDSLGVSNSA
jgi:uncharacterized protein YprB with RNaseH-like and TPR domain